MKLKGSEIICESLLREGVEALFGHPGGAILPFYDALWSVSYTHLTLPTKRIV